jgi:1-acyl-sn-glycerol-3-phosphate acyltransferase
LFPFAFLKVVLRGQNQQLAKIRQSLTHVMVAIAENWTDVNNLIIDIFDHTVFEIQGLEELNPQQSYFVCSNHQSWADIVILQRVFNRRIPFLRFFLKQELLWVPFLNVAWWALDFPFMKRYTSAYLAKHPEKKGQDLETTRRSCERFKGSPISVMNFLEGTRFTSLKHTKSKSPYKHLLPPKAGGLAFVLECMGEQFDSLLDVTIIYSKTSPTLWDLLSGKLEKVVVFITKIEIPTQMIEGEYTDDPAKREAVQAWTRQIWLKKDQLIDGAQTRTLN